MRGVRANGDAIRQLRKRLGLTQAQLAESAGCDVKTTRRAEQGHRLDIFNLRRIAAALGVPYADVVRQGQGRRSRELLHIDLVHHWLSALDDGNVSVLV